MAFEDIKECVQWAKSGGVVFAYFTAHSAKTTDHDEAPDHDTVRYACGELETWDNMLTGDLTTVFANDDMSKPTHDGDDLDVGFEGIHEGMAHQPRLSYHLELRPNGKISLRLKVDGQVSSARPEVTVAGSSVSPGLLRGASATAAYTVSLDRLRKAPK